jgi:hypothetical protein
MSRRRIEDWLEEQLLQRDLDDELEDH